MPGTSVRVSGEQDEREGGAAALRLMVTGFGPFPSAPSNPTEALVRTLAEARPEAFGAGALKTVLLPTEYRRSWEVLRRHYARFRPDVVVHFGLSARAEAIHVESRALNHVATARPDASGGGAIPLRARRHGPEEIAVTLPAEPLVTALQAAGFEAALSGDAGGYVCNATLYRSLFAAPAGRRVGFIHVPPSARLAPVRLAEAAAIVLGAATRL